MKKNIPVGAAVAVGVVLLIILGVIAGAMFFGNPNTSPNSEAAKKESKAIRAKSAINQHMKGGGDSTSSTNPDAPTPQSGIAGGGRGVYSNRGKMSPPSSQ